MKCKWRVAAIVDEYLQFACPTYSLSMTLSRNDVMSSVVLLSGRMVRWSKSTYWSSKDIFQKDYSPFNWSRRHHRASYWRNSSSNARKLHHDNAKAQMLSTSYNHNGFGNQQILHHGTLPSSISDRWQCPQPKSDIRQTKTIFDKAMQIIKATTMKFSWFSIVNLDKYNWDNLEKCSWSCQTEVCPSPIREASSNKTYIFFTTSLISIDDFSRWCINKKSSIKWDVCVVC